VDAVAGNRSLSRLAIALSRRGERTWPPGPPTRDQAASILCYSSTPADEPISNEPTELPGRLDILVSNAGIQTALSLNCI
jgi:hypothetical protein